MLFTKFSSASGGSSMTRQQILAQRDEAKKASSAQVPLQSVEGLDSRDAEAHMTAFKARHSNPNAPDFFYDSVFNAENFINAVLHFRQAEQIEYNSNGFDSVHAKLLERDENGRNYYEPRTRKRGEAAAKTWPVFVKGQNIITAPPQAEPVDEVTTLRRMSDADLRKAATSGRARTQEEALDRARQRDQEQAKADRETARNMPFSDLERLVRSGYRPQRAR